MKQRIITGLIMVFVALMSIIYLPTLYFSISLALVCFVGISEWDSLINLSKSESTKFNSIFWLIIGIAFGFSYHSTDLIPPIAIYFLMIMSVFWLAMPLILSVYAKSPLACLTYKLSLVILSILTLLAFILALSILHGKHWAWVILLITLVAGADSMAYFVGRKIGKRKLAPSISPGKSIEGALAGISSGLIIAIIAAFWIDMNILQTLGFIILCGIMVIISICGDLFESLIKRHRGVKDSGTILPGHGGVLDRIDALTAAAPLFVCGLFLLGIF